MPLQITRRVALAGSALLMAGGPAAATEPFREIERAVGGRLGVAAVSLGTGRRLAYREDERFAVCSTFKLLAAAFALARAERGEEDMGRRIVFDAASLVTYSPVTEKHAGPGGITVAEICGAAVELSDNTAANLLLASFGGPAGLTRFARSLGDEVTRLDRIETALNEAAPGDERDTTSPAAMLGSARALLVGEALSAVSRERLIAWLVASPTGERRLRAGFPSGWRVGGKTGSGPNGTANDVVIAWPMPGATPILVAAYLTGSGAAMPRLERALAEVGQVIARQLG